ncbi:MAG TPA: hypothetical protein VK645_13830 [Chitinophagaceae bacterium]|jgi:hypothetical protein|nr:hypothetical protein [Chitinophagaceae bacterium]
MKKQKGHNKKDLKKRLVSLLLIYLNGLTNRKRERVSDYMEDKLGEVLDYYLSLLNKKERKNFVLHGLSDEILFHHLTIQEKKAGDTKTDDLKK